MLPADVLKAGKVLEGAVESEFGGKVVDELAYELGNELGNEVVSTLERLEVSLN